MSESVHERMARVRAAKERKKREREELANTGYGNTVNYQTPSPAEQPRQSAPPTLPHPSYLNLSDMIGLYPMNPPPQPPPQINQDDDEDDDVDMDDTGAPPPVKIPVKKPQKEEDTPMKESSGSAFSFFSKAKDAVVSAASFFNDNTPSVSQTLITAGAKVALGVAAAVFLARSQPASSSSTGNLTSNRYSEPTFYM